MTPDFTETHEVKAGRKQSSSLLPAVSVAMVVPNHLSKSLCLFTFSVNTKCVLPNTLLPKESPFWFQCIRSPRELCFAAHSLKTTKSFMLSREKTSTVCKQLNWYKCPKIFISVINSEVHSLAP